MGLFHCPLVLNLLHHISPFIHLKSRGLLAKLGQLYWQRCHMLWEFKVVATFDQLLTDFLLISLLRNVVQFDHPHEIILVFYLWLKFLVHSFFHLLQVHLLYTFLGFSPGNFYGVFKFGLEYIVEYIEVRQNQITIVFYRRKWQPFYGFIHMQLLHQFVLVWILREYITQLSLFRLGIDVLLLHNFFKLAWVVHHFLVGNLAPNGEVTVYLIFFDH